MMACADTGLEQMFTVAFMGLLLFVFAAVVVGLLYAGWRIAAESRTDQP
jgi:hypothetical protein